jgi:predicted AAA+ superfamily ATPase
MSNNLIERIESLALFFTLKQDSVIKSLIDALKARKDNQDNISVEALFYHKLLESGYADDWSGYVYNLVRFNDNIWAKSIAKKISLPSQVKEQAKKELKILENLARQASNTLFENSAYIWGSKNQKSFDYDTLAQDIEEKGFGIYARYDAFVFEERNLMPIPNPPRIKLDALIGYHSQKQEIINNTKAFIEGKPANNVLLAGDRGSGKSSTVCGIFDMFRGRIKLVELPLVNIKNITYLINLLQDLPHRFIIFLDDLVVDKNNPQAYYSLKAALEGSFLNPKTNTLIYATSNRRHLVKQSFKDREDEVHKSEGLEDALALSDRFGLTVLFYNLNKDEYLDFVSRLAKRHNIEVNDKLLKDAEVWATVKAARSPRTAAQFINMILSNLD